MIYDLINKVFSSTIPFESVRIAAAARKLGVATFFPSSIVLHATALTSNKHRKIVFVYRNELRGCSEFISLFFASIIESSTARKKNDNKLFCCAISLLSFHQFLLRSIRVDEAPPENEKGQENIIFHFLLFCVFGEKQLCWLKHADIAAKQNWWHILHPRLASTYFPSSCYSEFE